MPKKITEITDKRSRTLIDKYGDDYFSRLGRKGGKVKTGRFKEGSKEAREEGRKGGRSRHERRRSVLR